MDDDDIGTVRWFGPTWNAPVNDPRAEVPVPVETDCIYCSLPIKSDDQGVTMPYLSMDRGPVRVAYHLNCFWDDLGIPHE
jgi:hypothetical protein